MRHWGDNFVEVKLGPGSLWFAHMENWMHYLQAHGHHQIREYTYEQWCALTGPQRDRILFLLRMPKKARQEKHEREGTARVHVHKR